MFWTEDDHPGEIRVPDDVADAVFAIECRQLPVDHAFELAAALRAAHPWIGEVPGLAVQPIHVAGSQNGWERPEHGTGSFLRPSRRTRLAIRADHAGVERLIDTLPGTRIALGGHALTLGEGRRRPLSKETCLHARYVVASPEQDEEAFLREAARALAGIGVRVRKALCGKTLALHTPDGPLVTRSLMLADLQVEESFIVQREGLGPQRLMGCGVFLPHKGIEAVKPQS
jgi:CRISPR-associated protein Cas6